MLSLLVKFEKISCYDESWSGFISLTITRKNYPYIRPSVPTWLTSTMSFSFKWIWTISSSPGLAERAGEADSQLQRWNQLLDTQRSLSSAVTAIGDRLRQLDTNPSTRRRALDTRHALQVCRISSLYLIDLCCSTRLLNLPTTKDSLHLNQSLSMTLCLVTS